MIWLVGAGPFLLVHLPIVALAASLGVWLFYVQHQFEETFWVEAQDWSHQDAALYGSSYYDLPPVLSWLTANIGVHHVHHLYSRIPYYRLPQLIKDYPELAEVRRITLRESFRTVRLKLWDAKERRWCRSLTSSAAVADGGRSRLLAFILLDASHRKWISPHHFHIPARDMRAPSPLPRLRARALDLLDR